MLSSGDRFPASDERAELSLPLDTLVQIFSRLPPRSLGICMCVCNAWRVAASTDGLWRQAYCLEYGSVFPELTRSSPDTTSVILPPGMHSWGHLFRRACTSSHRPYLALAGQMMSALEGIASWRALVRCSSKGSASTGRPADRGAASVSGVHEWRAFPARVSSVGAQSVWLRFTLPPGMVPTDVREQQLDMILQAKGDQSGTARCHQGKNLSRCSDGLEMSASEPGKGQVSEPEGYWQNEESLLDERAMAAFAENPCLENECFLSEEETATLKSFVDKEGDVRRESSLSPAKAVGGGGYKTASAGLKNRWFRVIRAIGFELVKDGDFVSENTMFHQAHVTGLYAYRASKGTSEEDKQHDLSVSHSPAGASPAIHFIAYIHTEQLLPTLLFPLSQSLSCYPSELAAFTFHSNRELTSPPPTSPCLTSPSHATVCPSKSSSLSTSSSYATMPPVALPRGMEELPDRRSSSINLSSDTCRLTSPSPLTTSSLRLSLAMEEQTAGHASTLPAGESSVAALRLAQSGGAGVDSQSEAARLGLDDLLVEPLRVYLDFINAEDSAYEGSCYAAMWLHAIGPQDDGASSSLLWAGPLQSITVGTTLAELADGEVTADITLFSSSGRLLMGRAGTELWHKEGGPMASLHFIPDGSQDELFANEVRLWAAGDEKSKRTKVHPKLHATGDGPRGLAGERKGTRLLHGGEILPSTVSGELHAGNSDVSLGTMEGGRIELCLTMDAACRVLRLKPGSL